MSGVFQVAAVLILYASIFEMDGWFAVRDHLNVGGLIAAAVLYGLYYLGEIREEARKMRAATEAARIAA